MKTGTTTVHEHNYKQDAYYCFSTPDLSSNSRLWVGVDGSSRYWHSTEFYLCYRWPTKAKALKYKALFSKDECPHNYSRDWKLHKITV